MKALVKTQPTRGAELLDVPIPEIGPDDLLVKVQAAAICGTDNHIYDWTPWAQARLTLPMIFGHEFAGEVAAHGADVVVEQPHDLRQAVIARLRAALGEGNTLGEGDLR